MKKRLLIAVTTMLMIALVGCGKEKTEKYEMETDSGKVTVEVTEDGVVSITEEKNETPSVEEVVYDEGTIPLGTYWREGSNGGYWLLFEENSKLDNFFRVRDCLIHETDTLSGTYTYDEESKLYTLTNVGRIPYVTTLYVDESDNYNLVVTNTYYGTGLDKLDIDNGIYDKNSFVDVELRYERQ